MKIAANQTESVRPTSVRPPAAVGDPTPALPENEAAAQAGFYLGYLDMLAKLGQFGDPASMAEINRIVAILLKLQPEITDTTIAPLLKSALASLAPGGKVTEASAGAYFTFCAPSVSGDSPLVTVYNWMSSYNFMFDPQTTSPDTYFAASMFLLAFMQSNWAQFGYNSKINIWMGQGLNNGAMVPAMWVIAQFLCAYCASNNNTPDPKLLAELFFQDTGNTCPYYDEFIQMFDASYPGWQPFFGTATGLMDILMSRLYYFMPTYGPELPSAQTQNTESIEMIENQRLAEQYQDKVAEVTTNGKK